MVELLLRLSFATSRAQRRPPTPVTGDAPPSQATTPLSDTSDSSPGGTSVARQRARRITFAEPTAESKAQPASAADVDAPAPAGGNGVQILVRQCSPFTLSTPPKPAGSSPHPDRVSMPAAVLVRAAMSLPVYVPYGVLGSSGPDFGMLVVWMNVG